MYKLLKYLEKQKVIRASDAIEYLSNRMAIKRLVEKGVLVTIGSGFYTLPKYDNSGILFKVIEKYFPDVVISGKTCLRIHKLGDDYFDKIDIDIPNTTSIKNSLFNVHRISENKIIGFRKEKVFGSLIKLYNKERALFEAYKLGEHYLFQTIKRYVKLYKNDINYNNIIKYEKIFKYEILKLVKQELLDGF
jgi:predicted transcriptional regulator of viral defense system